MHKIVSLILALAFASSTYCQDNTSKKLKELFDFHQNQNLFNGSVLIAKKGQILLNNGIGFHLFHYQNLHFECYFKIGRRKEVIINR
jgi:hypothetical protein